MLSILKSWLFLICAKYQYEKPLIFNVNSQKREFIALEDLMTFAPDCVNAWHDAIFYCLIWFDSIVKINAYIKKKNKNGFLHENDNGPSKYQ